MERIWGGRQLEKILKNRLSSQAPIGELWAMVDRPETQSIVGEGPLEGTSLHELWTQHRLEIFGKTHTKNLSPRFPLLCKLLDASESLSVQVHPPEDQAALLKGESKTECWYFLDTETNASIYAGLRQGVTKEMFQRALEKGTIETLLYQLPVKTGESMFIPSGRLHALGKGILLVEIQQNSDTTYRVFDWNRCDKRGQGRTLHLKESMSSINFEDYEPSLNDTSSNTIADCPHFHVEKWTLETPLLAIESNNFAIFTCLTGCVTCGSKTFHPGQFFLVPTSMQGALLRPEAPQTTLLRTRF